MRLLLAVVLLAVLAALLWAIFRFNTREWATAAQIAGGSMTVLVGVVGVVVFAWRKAVRTKELPFLIRQRTRDWVLSATAKGAKPVW